MSRIRRSTLIAVAAVCVLAASFGYQVFQFKRAFGVRDERVVQMLESSDGLTKAELIRRHAFLDLNFIIQLNGSPIFTSPDFKPTNRIPHRESLSWDETGKYLIFSVGGHRLFGYELKANRRIADKELLALKVVTLKPEDYGYSGEWPGLSR